MLADRITALRTANIYEPHVYCHQIERGEGDRARPRRRRRLARGEQLHRRAHDGDGRDDGVRLRALCSTGSSRRAAGRCCSPSASCVLDSRRIDTLLVVPI